MFRPFLSYSAPPPTARPPATRRAAISLRLRPAQFCLIFLFCVSSGPFLLPALNLAYVLTNHLFRSTQPDFYPSLSSRKPSLGYCKEKNPDFRSSMLFSVYWMSTTQYPTPNKSVWRVASLGPPPHPASKPSSGASAPSPHHPATASSARGPPIYGSQPRFKPPILPDTNQRTNIDELNRSELRDLNTEHRAVLAWSQARDQDPNSDQGPNLSKPIMPTASRCHRPVALTGIMVVLISTIRRIRTIAVDGRLEFP